MAIEIKLQKNGVTHLVIQDEMTIYHALEQKQALAQFLKNSKELQLDLSGVGEIDSAGVQVLLFLKKEAVKQTVKLDLIQHSQAVVEVLELLNLSKAFGDPIVISADWRSV